MKCRHCHINLKIINGSPFCSQCQSHYTSFAIIEKLMSEPKFINFKKESQKKSILSQYECDFCKQRMTLHLNSVMQFESCFRCQQAWFEKGELQKINSKALTLKSSDFTYDMTEHVSRAPLECFDHHHHIASPISDLEARTSQNQWMVITFVYETIINIIFFPIHYLVKKHPGVLFILVIIFFYFTNRYLNSKP